MSSIISFVWYSDINDLSLNSLRYFSSLFLASSWNLKLFDRWSSKWLFIYSKFSYFLSFCLFCWAIFTYSIYFSIFSYSIYLIMLFFSISIGDGSMGCGVCTALLFNDSILPKAESILLVNNPSLSIPGLKSIPLPYC